MTLLPHITLLAEVALLAEDDTEAAEPATNWELPHTFG
jgi:hypothetical protein